MKNIFAIASLALFLGFSACNPNIKSQEDQEAIKNDSINPQEGAGEGPVPEEVIK